MPALLAGPALAAVPRGQIPNVQNSKKPSRSHLPITEGFQGAMGELLCAIEEGRPPSHNARENLDSLALCFAALASADSGTPKTPGATHTEQGTLGIEQVEALMAEGVDLRHVVLSHLDRYPDIVYHREILASGVSVESKVEELKK